MPAKRRLLLPSVAPQLESSAFLQFLGNEKCKDIVGRILYWAVLCKNEDIEDDEGDIPWIIASGSLLAASCKLLRELCKGLTIEQYGFNLTPQVKLDDEDTLNQFLLATLSAWKENIRGLDTECMTWEFLDVINVDTDEVEVAADSDCGRRLAETTTLVLKEAPNVLSVKLWTNNNGPCLFQTDLFRLRSSALMGILLLCTRLTSLTLNGFYIDEDERGGTQLVIEQLGRLTNLTSLRLGKHLSTLTSNLNFCKELPKLQLINTLVVHFVDGASAPDPTVLGNTLRALPHLRDLKLVHPAERLDYIVAGMVSLQRLDIRTCPFALDSTSIISKMIPGVTIVADKSIDSEWH